MDAMVKQKKATRSHIRRKEDVTYRYPWEF